jgi:hypothetical protein
VWEHDKGSCPNLAHRLWKVLYYVPIRHLPLVYLSVSMCTDWKKIPISGYRCPKL